MSFLQRTHPTCRDARSRVSPVCLFFILAMSAANAQAEQLHIVVGGPHFRPYPVAVPAATARGATSEPATGLTEFLRVGTDLIRPLELVPPQTYLAPGKDAFQPAFADWSNIGASGLIRAEVATAASHQLHITMRFFDVVTQQEVVTETCVAIPPGEVAVDTPANTSRNHMVGLRRCAYGFLDKVVEKLTGEKGILSSEIAYVKRTDAGKAVFVCDVDGRNPRRITKTDALSLLPAWAPSGHHLLFTSYRENNPDLWRVDLRTRNMEWLSKRKGLNTGAAVSPDGQRIALTLSLDGNTEIYLMGWHGKNLRRLTDSWGQDVSPTWSPDGQRIAFVSSRSGNPHIYVMNADGSSPRRLTFQGTYNQEPDWSPRNDGQIVFTARDERLKYDIFLVHPTTGEITRLTQDEGDNESPSFSPDGHHIVFTSTRGSSREKKLFIMNVDGTRQRRISHGPGNYETPAWGPRLATSGTTGVPQPISDLERADAESRGD